MIQLRPLLYHIQNRKADVLDMVAMEALQRASHQVFTKAQHWRIDVAGTMTIGSPIITPTIPDQVVGDETQTCESVNVYRLEGKNDQVWYPINERAAFNAQLDKQTNVTLGIPRRFTDRFGKAMLDLIPDQAYEYKMTVAIAPTGHFEVVDIPHAYEMMLVEGAMSMLWEFGETANPAKADRARNKFLMLQGNFMADVITTGGVSLMTPNSLTPRRRF